MSVALVMFAAVDTSTPPRRQTARNQDSASASSLVAAKAVKRSGYIVASS
jgi:hypothetical protein